MPPLILLILMQIHPTLPPILRHPLGHFLRVHWKVLVMGEVPQGQGQRLMPHRMPQILMFHR